MSELKPCPVTQIQAYRAYKKLLEIMEDETDDQTEAFSAAYKALYWIANGRRAQPANEPCDDVCAMLEQAAQDMDDKCRQWQCVLQRVHDAGTFDQNSGLWVGVDKEREAKAQASFEAYRYALGVIDKIAEHVSNPYKFAHKPGGEQT